MIELVLFSVLQVSAKFGDNHRFCNIKVSKSFPSGHDQKSTSLLGNSIKTFRGDLDLLMGPSEPVGPLLAQFSDSTNCNVQ